MIVETDILGELVEGAKIIAEGEYPGEIVDTEFRVTTYRGTPFTSIKVALPKDKYVRIFILTPTNPSGLLLWKYLMSNIKGEKVKVLIRHRQHDDRTYVEGRITQIGKEKDNG